MWQHTTIHINATNFQKKGRINLLNKNNCSSNKKNVAIHKLNEAQTLTTHDVLDGGWHSHTKILNNK